MDLQASVKTGRKITLGKVSYEGNKLTRTLVLKNKVKLEPGKPLNRVQVEESRQRLAQLGVFDYVGVQYTNVNPTERDVIYNFKEEKPISLSVLAGYGSYEMLRGGLELEDRNVLGLAQDVRLRGIQSFKSSQGDLTYTVPEIFGKDVDLVLEGSGMRREEVSFTRQEYGGSAGIQKRLKPIQTDLTLRYNYQSLHAQNLASSVTNLVGVTNANSAAIDLGLVRDMRDNPLLPTRGLKLYTKIELAFAGLGGNVDYQRLVYGGSYIIHLHGGHLFHLNFVQGMTFTLGGTSQDLPFNKRFFPGGENSVRGYQEGEASPLDANGNQLGAETFTQANVEFEQLITKSWAVVTFFDAVGIAESRSDYPWDQGLYSVGGGLSWRTLIGPVRLEYGYNLHRRKFDPVGTLHFSIGFPF